TFVQVMIAVYIPWLSGAELERTWRTLMSRPLAEGEGERPRRGAGWRDLLARPFDRLRYRGPRPAIVVHHAVDEASVRRVALLRCWDLGARLRYEADPDAGPGSLQVSAPG